MIQVLGIVPARAGSKRLPGKNLRLLGDKALCAWAMEAGLGASTLAELVVSSDDAQVLATAERYGIRAILRPPELATDTSPAIDYVRHALVSCEASRRFDAVAIIQPTSPFTTGADIDACVRLLESSGSDSAVTVMPLDHAIHPLKLKRLEGDRLLPYLEEERGRMAAHELEALYVRNGAVYVSSRRTIDAGSLLGDDSRAHVMSRERSIDINDALDFSFAEFLLARGQA